MSPSVSAQPEAAQLHTRFFQEFVRLCDTMALEYQDADFFLIRETQTRSCMAIQHEALSPVITSYLQQLSMHNADNRSELAGWEAMGTRPEPAQQNSGTTIQPRPTVQVAKMIKYNRTQANIAIKAWDSIRQELDTIISVERRSLDVFSKAIGGYFNNSACSTKAKNLLNNLSAELGKLCVTGIQKQTEVDAVLPMVAPDVTTLMQHRRQAVVAFRRMVFIKVTKLRGLNALIGNEWTRALRLLPSEAVRNVYAGHMAIREIEIKKYQRQMEERFKGSTLSQEDRAATRCSPSPLLPSSPSFWQ